MNPGVMLNEYTGEFCVLFFKLLSRLIRVFLVPEFAIVKHQSSPSN